MSNKKCKFNENYFEKIDRFDNAYFLGLLYSDGSNCSHTTAERAIVISLQEEDVEILKRFKEYSDSEYAIIYRKPKENIRKGQYRFYVYSRK